MDLNQLRECIDRTDDEIVRLVTERMDIAAKIAAYKKENKLPVYHPAREREKLADVASKTRDELKNDMQSLYQLLFELSRSQQNRVLLPKRSEGGRGCAGKRLCPCHWPCGTGGRHGDGAGDQRTDSRTGGCGNYVCHCYRTGKVIQIMI